MGALTLAGPGGGRPFAVVGAAAGVTLALAASFAVVAGYVSRSGDEVSAFEPATQRDVQTIARLADLRSDLRHVEILLAESTEGETWDPGSMRRLLESVDRESALVRTAYAEGVDLRLRGAAFDAIAQARAGVSAVRGELDAGRFAEARRQMRATLGPQLQSADAAIAMLLRSNIEDLSLGLARDARVRRGEARVAVALDAACAAAALILGVLAVLALRREHARLRGYAAELEMFADRVAHDVRSPLLPVMLALSEASRDAEEPTRAFLERGVRSLRVVTDIVDGLHAFATSRAGPRAGARAGLREVIEDVVADAAPEAEQADVHLAVLDVDDALVRCEPGVLASIVSNLVRNAIRYMDRSRVRRLTVSASVEGRSAAIVVQDTGPGLPPGFERRAFVPYARPEGARRLGLGLGLATVKRLAEGHGGGVTVRSTPRGCTFVVQLPVAAPASDAELGEDAHGD